METLQEYLDTIPNDENRAKLEQVIQWVTKPIQILKSRSNGISP